MELDFTDDQKMLADTVRTLLEKRYDANTRLQLLESSLGWSREMWKQYADLGLLGLAIEEQYGGAGAGVGELAVVLEQFGRALVLEPFLATVVLGGGLVAAVGSTEQKKELLPKIAAGETLLAFAATEPGSRWSLSDINTVATDSGDGWTLNGRKISVLGGDVANNLLVTARMEDGEIGLFIVDTADDSVHRDKYRMQDGLGGADVHFDGAPALPLGDPGGALPAIEGVIETATALLCAEAVGAMDRMLGMTVDYLKTRVQFGQPLSDFQALQFRAADMFVSVEQARSMSILARHALPQGDATERRRQVLAAKIQVDMSSRHVSQNAIQLHGAIATTMEYPVGHFMKRTAVIAKSFADTDTLIAAVGADEGLIKVSDVPR